MKIYVLLKQGYEGSETICVSEDINKMLWRILWGRGKLKKKAEEKLINDISEGKENAPEECYDSDATVTEILSE